MRQDMSPPNGAFGGFIVPPDFADEIVGMQRPEAVAWYVRWLKGYFVGEFLLSILLGRELRVPIRENIRISLAHARTARR